MAGIKWRNMTLRILSVLLALLLWVYATNEQNPVNDQILSIQLQRRDPPKGIEITSSIPSNVSIRVQGPRTQVTSLGPTDFQAVLDLSAAAEGDHYIPVKVTSPPGVQVTMVTPPRVYVVAEAIVEKQVDVSAALKGTPAKGFIALAPAVQPSRVTVRGPRSRINAVDQLKVTVDVEGATGAVEQTVPVTAGQEGVSVAPQSVRVIVPINQLPSKSVVVRPRVEGDPARDYEVTGVTTSPVGVQVVAPAGVLAGVNSVDTEKIDVRGLDRDTIFKIAVTPPQGAVEVRPATVDVTVQVRKKTQPATPTAPARP